MPRPDSSRSDYFWSGKKYIGTTEDILFSHLREFLSRLSDLIRRTAIFVNWLTQAMKEFQRKMPNDFTNCNIDVQQRSSFPIRDFPSLVSIYFHFLRPLQLIHNTHFAVLELKIISSQSSHTFSDLKHWSRTIFCASLPIGTLRGRAFPAAKPSPLTTSIMLSTASFGSPGSLSMMLFSYSRETLYKSWYSGIDEAWWSSLSNALVRKSPGSNMTDLMPYADTSLLRLSTAPASAMKWAFVVFQESLIKTALLLETFVVALCLPWAWISYLRGQTC